VIYEMHVGTFTEAGNWAAAQAELSELARLGITLVEAMPVADFPGNFGWGYDGVNLFAPSRLYGTPDDFRSFVNSAHDVGIGVILDVVYNHVGSDGNYLKEFSKDYFSNRYTNEWGEALNFDGENCHAVREFFTENAAYWIDEFHLDGLRLDAVQQIFDVSQDHIVAAIGQSARAAGKHRSIFLVAENEVQHARVAQPLESGGYGLDALWNDDFHHSATVAATGRREAYYSDYRGTPQELIAAAKWGFLYQGQWSPWQKKPRGTPAFCLEPDQFVDFLQNHDQVANSLHGRRLHQLTSPGRFRALTTLLLLLPSTPMLFQGQEFCASTPFLYFADHHAELARLVFKGRKEFLRQFPTITAAESQSCLADPSDESTFRRSKLNFAERQKHREIYEFHRELLRLRREDPTFSKLHHAIEGAVVGPEAFLLRFFGQQGDDRLLLVNLGADLSLQPMPEPLLAAPEGREWDLVLSSEATCYGGVGTPPFVVDGRWLAPGQAAVVLRAKSFPA
jgi:maltooligosyltrehalose trehalohydrolase